MLGKGPNPIKTADALGGRRPERGKTEKIVRPAWRETETYKVSGSTILALTLTDRNSKHRLHSISGGGRTQRRIPQLPSSTVSGILNKSP